MPEVLFRKNVNVMQSSRIYVRKWLVAICLRATNLQKASNRKLTRDLVITQKSTWYMNHWLRKAFEEEVLGRERHPNTELCVTAKLI